MKVLKVEIFQGYHPWNGLIEFVNKNQIPKEDILMITEGVRGYSLFYYR